MGSIEVDQIDSGGTLVQAVDTTLRPSAKHQLIRDALPGSDFVSYAGKRLVTFADQLILSAQVTHLGRPWPGFKKRIQIPPTWKDIAQRASLEGRRVRFVGVYHHDGVTIFVDFDPVTYMQRKANNSAAHVSTNDLFQAQTLGQFTRTDRNGNRLTSVRSDQFAAYLRFGYQAKQPRVDVFHGFNTEFLAGAEIQALDAVKEMRASDWPDTFQGEWPGFYVEYRLDAFLRRAGLGQLVEYQKVKGRGLLDYDLAFKKGGDLEYYGDLKASDVTKHESPGNDAEDIRRCVEEYGRFWYIIYEHETKHARDDANRATIEWNEWKRSVGFKRRKDYDPLSYASRFKASVRFVKMMILEVNEANFHVVLGDFTQGKQQSGAARALKVMIKKKNIDNFLIYSEAIGER